MKIKALFRLAPLFFIGLTITLTSCSSVIKEVLEKPDISISQFRLVKAGFIDQKFTLTLDVSNPNPVSLPIKSIVYTISLAGEQLVSGESFESFTVPAHGNESFDILFKINILRSAAHLRTIIKNGASDIHYQLVGSIDIDLPLMGLIPIDKQGSISLKK